MASSCLVNFNFKHESAEFKKLRNEIFETMQNVFGIDTARTLDLVYLSRRKKSAVDSSGQLKQAAFNELTQEDFEVFYRMYVKEMGDIFTANYDDVTVRLQDEVLSAEEELAKTLRINKNAEKIQNLEAKIAQYRAVIQELQRLNNLPISQNKKVNKFIANIKSTPTAMSLLQGLFDFSRVALPQQIAQKGKKLPINTNLHRVGALKFSSFVDSKERIARINVVTGQTTITQEEGLVADAQILLNKMQSTLTRFKHIQRVIANQVESIYKGYGNRNVSDQEKQTINDLIYKLIENDAYNTKGTRRHLGINGAGEAYNLPVYFINNVKSSLPVMSTSELSGSDVKGTFVDLEDYDRIFRQNPKSVKTVKTFTDGYEIVLDREAFVEEEYAKLLEKSDSAIVSEISLDIMKTAISGAMLYRDFYQTELKNLLSRTKEIYRAYADFYQLTKNHSKEAEFREAIANIKEVNMTYVPRYYDGAYFNVDVVSDILAELKVYNFPTNPKPLKEFTDRVATKHGLNPNTLYQWVYSYSKNDAVDPSFFGVFLDKAKNLNMSDEDIAKKYNIDVKNPNFIQMIHLAKAANGVDDLFMWTNLLNRESNAYIPTLTDIDIATDRYINLGVRKIHTDMISYQHQVHRYIANSRAIADQYVDPKYAEASGKLWQYFDTYVESIVSSKYIEDTRLLSVINKDTPVGAAHRAVVRMFFMPGNIMGDKNTNIKLSRLTAPMSDKELKLMGMNLNKLLHFWFMGLSPLSPIKNYIGSTKAHLITQGIGDLNPPKDIMFNNQRYDINVLMEEAGVASFVEYVDEVYRVIKGLPSSEQQKTMSSLSDLFSGSSSLDVIMSVLNDVKSNISLSNWAESFTALFKISEILARRHNFARAISKAASEYQMNKEDAMQFALGTVATIDGLYDASGKVVASNGVFRSVFFKYMNYGIYQINWKAKTFKHSAVLKDLSKFLSKHSDAENPFTKENFKEWMSLSQNPSGILLRQLAAEMMVASVSVMSLLGTALFYWFKADDDDEEQVPKFINGMHVAGDELVRASIAIANIALSAMGAEDNSQNAKAQEREEYSLLEHTSDANRQIPLGVGFAMAADMGLSVLRQAQGDEEAISRNVSSVLTPRALRTANNIMGGTGLREFGLDVNALDTDDDNFMDTVYELIKETK